MNLTDPQRADLSALYAELDAEIARHAPRCVASGKCCRFMEYGHDLFLSAAEAELLLGPGLPGGTPEDFDGRAGCPYQIGGLCTARERRPIGCRVYFCDPAWADAMPLVAEEFHRRLKALHDDWGRPWDYRVLAAFLPNATPNGLRIVVAD